MTEQYSSVNVHNNTIYLFVLKFTNYERITWGNLYDIIAVKTEKTTNCFQIEYTAKQCIYFFNTKHIQYKEKHIHIWKAQSLNSEKELR